MKIVSKGVPVTPSAPTPAAPSAPSAPKTSAPSSPFGGGAPKPSARIVPETALPTDDGGFDNFVDSLDAPPTPIKGAKEPAAEETAGVDPNNRAFPEPPGEVEDDELETPETPTASAEPDAAANGKHRDYSQFDPEVAAILKKLPNSLYDKFSSKLAEWKSAADELPALKEELQKVTEGKPRFLSEHPDAYKLTTEYDQALKNYQDASTESNHWAAQIKRIKNGEPWTMLELNSAGDIVGRQMPAPTDGRIDVDAELEVMQMLQNCNSARGRLQDKLSNMGAEHKVLQQSALQATEKAINSFFPKLDIKKLPKAEKELYDKTFQSIPEVYQQHPLAKIAPLCFVAVHRVATWAQRVQAENDRLKGRTPAAAVGPRGTANGRVKPGGGDEIIDIDAMFDPKR